MRYCTTVGGGGGGDLYMEVLDHFVREMVEVVDGEKFAG